MLTVNDIHTYYGNIHALKGISLHVNEGEIVTLIGGNGAGKTTTLNTISGITPATEGQVTLAEQDITTMAPHNIVRAGVVQSPEGRKVFTRLTVRENLEMGAFTRTDGGIERDLEDVFKRFPRLKERENQLSGTMSGGEQQMLAMGRALMAKPRILLLDEPSMGLAPLLVKQVFEAIEYLNRQNGTTILLVEQNARMALEVANRGYVLQSGRITHDGPAKELQNDKAIIEAYLGG
ncbi:MAG: ABC transporter ATP-binding protein [Anaerolineaceae bacterium]|nr:ABC transporter ATP-binding protein [Anaerolineaceae bacterium]